MNNIDKPCSDVLKTKLNIHEAYESGIITESEKYELLEILEEANGGENTQKKKNKLLKAIGLTIGLITLVLALPIIYMILKDTTNKYRNSVKNIASLKKRKSQLQKMSTELRNKKDITDDELKKYTDELDTIYKVTETLASLIINYDGNDIQRSKAKSLMSEIDTLIKDCKQSL